MIHGMDPIPPELFLEASSPGIREACERLRAVVKRAVPDAVERVRPGWRLIGYDIPLGKRTRYFAFIWPEPEHAHMGWEHGILMDDPEHILRGAHINLRKVRYVTYQAGEAIPEKTLVEYTRHAATIAAMSRGERMARMLDRD